MRRRSSALATTTLLMLALIPSLLHAQSKTTGAIRGVVTDENGARIPGVLVELQSPDMIGGRRAQTTDTTGSYRFPELPPGHYTMVFTIDGYQKLTREGIVVSGSKSFDLPIQLTPRAGEETITVEGQAPLVDVT